MSQSPSPPLSGGRGFYKEGEGNRTKRSRERVANFCTCRRAQSIPIRQMMVSVRHPGVVTLASHHPGLLSSWLHS